MMVFGLLFAFGIPIFLVIYASIRRARNTRALADQLFDIPPSNISSVDREMGMKPERMDVLLKEYGAYPKPESRDEIRGLLAVEIENENNNTEGHEFMRILCYLLFSIGNVEDCELICKAKALNMDAGCMIDSVFLCGAGYEETLSYANTKGLTKVKNWVLDNVDKGFDKEEVVNEFKGYYRLK